MAEEGGATDVMVKAGSDPLGRVVAFLRRRPWVRRLLSALSVGLLLAAVGLLGYPFYTNLYQDRLQRKLGHQLASPGLEEAYRSGTLGTGDALTRLRIPAIDLDVVVVEGTTASALRAGAGHYVNTPLPCEAGNVGIAGHRTTYGRPFNHVDLLQPGDTITLQTPVGQCTYRVDQAPFATSPFDTSVVANTHDAMLTLTTCHPKGSARQRLIIKARLVGQPAPA
ncbi:MAG: class E sortase [Acidobacteria bacterium]|nr:class E sortase [Acidobacteriota bacterium]